MTRSAGQQVAHAARSADGLLLAADVGGTYARVGLVQTGTGAPVVSSYRKYRCADHPNLAAILKDFLASEPSTPVVRGAIACAGYALDDAIINNNLPWRVSLTEIRRALGLDDLLLVNDFTAIAYAAGYVGAQEVTSVAAASRPLDGPVLVVGPGTGLGAAVRIPGTPPTILSTEAGQAALTPSTEMEIEILRRLLRNASHVPVEQVLSGPGLANLHAVIGALRGAAPAALSPSQITQAAIVDKEPIALESLRVFCGWLGSVVGNLVLLYGAQGGVYLAGGILPQIREFLLQSDFVARFRDKGPMRALLERVPVNLIEHGQLGVLGAAGWYLDQQRVT
ncbi:MAG: glucokinase [Rudaea sp.]|nr:glucokinase [Rudaea sp.]